MGGPRYSLSPPQTGCSALRPVPISAALGPGTVQELSPHLMREGKSGEAARGKERVAEIQVGIPGRSCC